MTTTTRNDYADRVAPAVRDIAAGLDRALDPTALAKAAAAPSGVHRGKDGVVPEPVLAPTAPMYERYLDTPADAAPHRLRTLLCAWRRRTATSAELAGAGVAARS